MPYCNERKLLFIHIPKTAGKSVGNSIFLQKYEISQNSILFKALNYLYKKNSQTFNNLIGSYNYSFHTQHLTYFEILEYFTNIKILSDPEIKIFTVVRNPFDRLVSTIHHWNYEKINKGEIDIDNRLVFHEKVNEWFTKETNQSHNLLAHKRSMYEFLMNKNGDIDNRIKILRYENLENDFKLMCNQFDIKYKPLRKIGQSQKNNDYQKYFNNDCLDYVQKFLIKDLSYFKYSF